MICVVREGRYHGRRETFELIPSGLTQSARWIELSELDVKRIDDAEKY
jgi:hypothetical protein